MSRWPTPISRRSPQRSRINSAVGGTFTLADLTLAYTLKWSRVERIIGADLLAPFPRLIEYTNLHTSRPAFPRELYS
jgi:glutathione S-transferase